MSTPPVSPLITRGLCRILGMIRPPRCRRQRWNILNLQNFLTSIFLRGRIQIWGFFEDSSRDF